MGQTQTQVPRRMASHLHNERETRRQLPYRRYVQSTYSGRVWYSIFLVLSPPAESVGWHWNLGATGAEQEYLEAVNGCK